MGVSGIFIHKYLSNYFSKPFTYALCLDHLGEDIVQEFIGREPSGRGFNDIALDRNGKQILGIKQVDHTILGLPHNPMVNSGAIMSAALLLYKVKPELCTSDKFELVNNFFTRMAGGFKVGFQNTVFLSEKETADRNYALAYFMREMGCFRE